MSMRIILMICGVFWVVYSFVTNTHNFKSAVAFKVIPFFTGFLTILCAMNLFGWVSIFK